MTDSTLTTTLPPQTTATTAVSGADLARVALHQAREAAKQRGAQTRAPRRPKHVTLQRDRRDPAGFATVIQSLMAERAWDLPSAGGNILDRWPDIAAAIAPNLATHATAVSFHPDTGRLDLRPDSPAYGTQLRLFTNRIITAANEQAGTTAVREVRVLPAGTAVPTPAVRTAPAVETRPATSPGPVRTRETASPGYHLALAAHLAAVNPKPAPPAPDAPLPAGRPA